MRDKYFIEKEIDKFKKYGYTGFVNEIELNTIKRILNKSSISYDIYKCFEDADKSIIYTKLPGVTCFKIITNEY